jgi:hypothetical protein
MQRCAATESFAAVPEPPKNPEGFDKFVETLTTMFPIWVSRCHLATEQPAVLSRASHVAITHGLALQLCLN